MPKIRFSTYGIHKIEFLPVLSPFGHYMYMADGCRKCKVFGKGLTMDCPEQDTVMVGHLIADNRLDFVQGDWVNT